MAARGKTAASRLESDIERSREESNWHKVVELAESLKERSPGSSAEVLATFLIGEGKLEGFLSEHPPTDQNITRAKVGLNDARKNLLYVTGQMGEKVGVALDAHLLLGKLHYAMGMYEEALSHFDKVELDSLAEKSLASRGLRIVAESYAVKGLSLDKLPITSTSRYKQIEREQRIIHYFEVAGDLALLYLQEQDKLQGQNIAVTATGTLGGSNSPVPPNSERQIGAILETVLQRAPILHIQRGQLQNAISRYRTILRAVESTATQSLRLTLMRQLAEVLLRGMSPASYYGPDTPAKSERNAVALRSTTAPDSPWKPKRYTGTNQFLPQNRNEEVLLLLIINEAMAVRDAVLSQSPEFKEMRRRASDNASAVYDLLTIALTEWGQTEALCESYERALKFSFEDAHIWTQFAFSLASSSSRLSVSGLNHTLSATEEAVRLAPTSSAGVLCLAAAKMCYEAGDVVSVGKGLSWAMRAAEKEQASPQNIHSRSSLYIGIGHCLQRRLRPSCEHNEHKMKAVEAFRKAQQFDPGDHLPEYYLALMAAEARQLSEAVVRVRTALGLYQEHLPSLHLLALLLTAQKQYHESLVLIEAALQEYPDSLQLLYVRAHLEARCVSSEASLLTAKHLLMLWKSKFEKEALPSSGVDGTDGPMATLAGHHRASETRSLFFLPAIEANEKDTSSVHAYSVTAKSTTGEVAGSEVGSSSLGSPSGRGNRHPVVQAWMMQNHIWLLTAELYLDADQPSQAESCLNEATQLFPSSHHIFYMRGILHEHRREFTEARSCFQNALSLCPTHVKSMEHLALVHHYLGSHRLAEKILRDAIRIEPLSYHTWYTMGKVLEALGQYESASECMATALEIETSSPILPFESIPICFE